MVESLGRSDIWEMAGFADLLVTATGNEGGVPGSLAPHTAGPEDANAGTRAVKSKLMIAAGQPRYPTGVVTWTRRA